FRQQRNRSVLKTRRRPRSAVSAGSCPPINSAQQVSVLKLCKTRMSENNMSQTLESAARTLPAKRELFGQPLGLFTLFFTEMWERFTYYGMRAMLILFMVDAVSRGGLGIDDRTANSIYGLYMAGGWLLALLGGYIADRLIGQQRAVLVGG